LGSRGTIERGSLKISARDFRPPESIQTNGIRIATQMTLKTK